MKALSVEKIRKLEHAAKKIGLTERILIENASSNLASIIDNLNLGKKVCVVAGKGNNGADALACARKLAAKNYNVKAVILIPSPEFHGHAFGSPTGRPGGQPVGNQGTGRRSTGANKKGFTGFFSGAPEEKDFNEEVKFQKELLDKIKIPVCAINLGNIKKLKKYLKASDFVLDGILGIGAKGGISDFLKKIISEINESGKKIVSCDIPSGLSPDSGVILGEAIKADYTITFIAPKKGFSLSSGPKLCGKIYVADIGVSKNMLEKV